jgi:hypothetical protein
VAKTARVIVAAAAILIDATVVRMVLVPALMRLLGERAWWTPRRRAGRPAPASIGSSDSEDALRRAIAQPQA